MLLKNSSPVLGEAEGRRGLLGGGRTVVSVFVKGLDCATASAIVCTFSLHPSNLHGREAKPEFSLPEWAQKKREPFDSRFVPPQVVPVMRCVPLQPDFYTMV